VFSYITKSKFLQNTMQTPKSRNLYLLNYLEDQHSKRSRYDIDRDLLEVGYSPGELDLAWNNLKNPQPAGKFNRQFVTYLLIVLVVLIIVTIVILASLSVIGTLSRF
jgi:hypothetical protein